MLLYLSYRYDFCHSKYYRISWYYTLLVIFILVAGLRYRLGVDSIRYESGFQEMPTLTELLRFDFSSSRYAPGYIAFSAIARSISSEFVIMQLLHATFVNCVIFWFIKKYTSRIFFAVGLYFVMLYSNFMCEVMRESCAVSFFLLGFPYFVKKNWIRYYIFAFLSFFFHPSAFVTFILPIFYIPVIRSFFKIDKRTILVLAGVYVFGVIVSFALFDYIKLINIASVQESASLYKDNSLSGQILNLNGIISTAILYLIYPILAVICNRKRLNYYHVKDSSFFAIELMVSLCMIVAILAIPIALFYRYNNYFYPFAIIAISNFVFNPIILPHHKKLRFKYSYWILIFLPLIFFKFYGLYRPVPDTQNLRDGMRYYPYSSIFTKDKNSDRESLYYFYHAF